eukprot:6495860-Prymnesium_polylepis.7
MPPGNRDVRKWSLVGVESLRCCRGSWLYMEREVHRTGRPWPRARGSPTAKPPKARRYTRRSRHIAPSGLPPGTSVRASRRSRTRRNTMHERCLRSQMA